MEKAPNATVALSSKSASPIWREKNRGRNTMRFLVYCSTLRSRKHSRRKWACLFWEPIPSPCRYALKKAPGPPQEVPDQVDSEESGPARYQHVHPHTLNLCLFTRHVALVMPSARVLDAGGRDGNRVVEEKTVNLLGNPILWVTGAVSDEELSRIMEGSGVKKPPRPPGPLPARTPAWPCHRWPPG